MLLACVSRAMGAVEPPDGKPEGDGTQPLPILGVLQIVHRDMQRINEKDRRWFRYFDQHHEPSAKVRLRRAATLFGHVNGLSREPDIVRPIIVDPGVWVVRIDLREYGKVFAVVYDKLADADQVYHAQVVKLIEERKPWPGGFYAPEKKEYAKGAFTLVTERKEVKTAIAPLLVDSPAKLSIMNDLVRWTGSSVPVVPLDWFINQTIAQQDRNPGYYDFLGVKNEKDFQKLIGFNEQVAADFGLTEMREAVAKSTVTRQPRAVRFDEKIGGDYWRSFDFQLAVDRRNPLRVLGKDIEAKYDASEQFGHLANRWWAVGIFNKQGVRQDAAPGQIASSSISKTPDRQVHVGISCFGCHDNGGLQDVNGWVHNLNQPPDVLQSPDFDIQKRLRQEYGRKLESRIDAGRARYEAAVKEATGWTSKEYASALLEAFEAYEDADCDLAWFAARLSTTPDKLKAALVAHWDATKSQDLLVSAIRKGGSIPIRQAEESFGLVYLAWKGHAVP